MYYKYRVAHVPQTVKYGRLFLRLRRMMHLLTTVMMAFWIWEYIKHHLYRLPDLVIHALIVPGTTYAAWSTPDHWRYVLAATGGVLLLHTLAGSTPRTKTRNRRSNMPPLP